MSEDEKQQPSQGQVAKEKTEQPSPQNDTKETTASSETDAEAKVEAPVKVADAPQPKKPDAPTKPAGAAKPAAGAKPAAKPKKAPPPPDPRVIEAEKMAETIKQDLVEKFGEEAVAETGAAHHNPMLVIEKSYWLKAVDYLRTHENWLLNYVECMAGADYADYIETVIYVQSTKLGHFVCLKTRTDREKSEMPSLVSAHPGVNWEEREIYDLLGVHFTGHPDLRRIMMWDDFEGHPLRKDYNEWD